MNSDSQHPAATTIAGAQSNELSERLQFFRRSIAKKKWSILGLTLLAGLVAAFFANSMTPIYLATATLYVEPVKSNVVSIPDVYTTRPGDHCRPGPNGSLRERSTPTASRLVAAKTRTMRTPRTAP